MSEQLTEVVARCKGSVHLAINEDRNYYESRRDWVMDEFENLSDDERERLIVLPDLYELQFYPQTPIGFHRVYGGSLEEVTSQALRILRQEDRG